MKAIKTWAKDRVTENAMNDDHRHLWQQLILHMAEDNVAGRSVLDYGCNQGGFLRLLFELKPFHRGTGADIALDSLALARQRAGRLPLQFVSVSELKEMTAAFDVAFSHEVVYLLPDLDAHAALMRRVLKPGASTMPPSAATPVTCSGRAGARSLRNIQGSRCKTTVSTIALAHFSLMGFR
jgi:SAM-dependent methyltransferase